MAKFININTEETIEKSTKIEAVNYFKINDPSITLFHVKQVPVKEANKVKRNKKKVQLTKKENQNGEEVKE